MCKSCVYVRVRECVRARVHVVYDVLFVCVMSLYVCIVCMHAFFFLCGTTVVVRLKRASCVHSPEIQNYEMYLKFIHRKSIRLLIRMQAKFFRNKPLRAGRHSSYLFGIQCMHLV